MTYLNDIEQFIRTGFSVIVLISFFRKYRIVLIPVELNGEKLNMNSSSIPG